MQYILLLYIQGDSQSYLMKYRTRKLIESTVDTVCIALLLLLLTYVVVSMRKVDVDFSLFGVMPVETKLQKVVPFCSRRACTHSSVLRRSGATGKEKMYYF